MFGIHFKEKKMNDYHDLFLKSEVLIIVAVFEKIRNSSLESYELCPSYYLNAPALTWDAMLNIAKV